MQQLRIEASGLVGTIQQVNRASEAIIGWFPAPR